MSEEIKQEKIDILDNPPHPLDNGLKPDEIKTDEAVKPEPVDEKRWGMPEAQVKEFFYLVFLGLERMSQRQRTFFRRNTKAACRDLNALWLHGKPMDKIRQEAADVLTAEKSKTNIIIPEGVNVDKLKEPPHA